ncbi:MAG: hypothetical protein AAGG56_15790 [Pseudomonadota bacterium]
MPVAQVLISDRETLSAEAIVDSWDAAAGIGVKSEMTVSLVEAPQGGRRYAAPAQLCLPSPWNACNAKRLQEGLAQALCETLRVPRSAIQVITFAVPSGSFVEDGRTLEWPDGN